MAALQGDPDGQYNLGVCYIEGRGVGVDCAEAASWFRRAAEQDHAGAQYNLGVCYYMGRGVAADKTEARRWIAAAAEKGNADAVRALRLFD